MKASPAHLIRLGLERTTSCSAAWTYASEKKRVMVNGRRPVIKVLGVGTVPRIPSSFDFPGPPLIQSQISKLTCFFSFVLFFLISFCISIGNFTVRCRLPTIMISILRNFYLQWKRHWRCKQQIQTGERVNGNNESTSKELKKTSVPRPENRRILLISSLIVIVHSRNLWTR